MPHAEHSVVIYREPHDVYEFVVHGENNARWRPSVCDCACVSKVCDAAGARYRQHMRGPRGRRIAADYEIVDVQPDQRIEFRVTAGPARPTGMYEFDPVDGGEHTAVHFMLDWRPRGWQHFLSPMVSRQMPREVTPLDNLKRLLEQDGGSAGVGALV